MHVSKLLSINGGISGAYKTMCHPLLEKFGLPQVSFDILMCLANNPEFYTAAQISGLRHLKPNLVSLYVERLVEEAYLRRENVNGDRRKVRLVLTEKAAPVVTQGRQMQREFYQALTCGLTQEELETFRRCVRVAGENAEAIRKGAGNGENTEESIC